jgi:hypothetical protein
MTAAAIRRDGPAGRFYEVNGQLLPSVTHILSAIHKPALVPWAANQERALVLDAATTLHRELATAPVPSLVSAAWYRQTLLARLGPTKAHQRQLAAAGDIGTQAHKAIEWLMRTAIGANAGPEPRISAPALIAVQAFQVWAASVQLKPVLVERTVYSLRHQYAGTLDLLARVHGVLTQVDFKTGKAIYGESHLQAAAYSAALEEMGYLEPINAIVVRLPKVVSDPGFEVVDVPARAELLPVFLATRTLWAWTYANEAKYRARRKVA